MKKIFINACNCHQGGGKTLLDAFISGIENQNYYYIFYIDTRYNPSNIYNQNITFKKISILKRLLVSFMIKKQAKKNDIIIFFGNLPPLLKFKNLNVILLLSNRFYVDRISFKGFDFRDIIKIKLEKLYFNLFKTNVNEFIVQTNTMKNLLQNSLSNNYKIQVLPFENSFMREDEIFFKKKNTFIYVASLIPYKNHKKLLHAWNKLNNAGISVKLYLTIDQHNDIKDWIKMFINENKLNVILLENISRSELMNIYKSCEYLIFPSYFEAYGLPLIEAVNYKLKILAADVDYCWDLITPNDYFNPHDVSSIERCILRAIEMKIPKADILNPKDFINKII